MSVLVAHLRFPGMPINFNCLQDGWRIVRRSTLKLTAE